MRNINLHEKPKKEEINRQEVDEFKKIELILAVGETISRVKDTAIFRNRNIGCCYILETTIYHCRHFFFLHGSLTQSKNRFSNIKK